VIHSLEIENFKAFGRRINIPFAPITLIFGQNSAGKSSILHALNLLKQTRESREAGALLLPRTEKGIVDLGSFQELLFNHDLRSTLSFKIETSNRYIPPRFRSLPLQRTAIEFNFSRPSVEEEVKLLGLKIFMHNQTECLATFEPADIEKDFWRGVPFLSGRERRLTRSRIRAVKCASVSERADVWEPTYNLFRDRKEQILSSLKARWNRLSQEKDLLAQNPLLSESGNEEEDTTTEVLTTLRQSINFFSEDFSLRDFIERRKTRALGAIIAIDGFMPIPMPRRGTRFPEDAFIDEGILDVTDVTYFCARSLENSLETLFPLGPFRRAPERWYIFTGTSPQDVGYEGDLLPDLLFRRPELVKDTNEWLERLAIGYTLSLRSVGSETKDLFEVRLIDNRKTPCVEVSLTDVGFGISQLLPFIVQSLAAQDQIISIEQPEVHIHPKLQADLGDLLAAAIRQPRNNQFIIETHSEHLILRILRRIRENMDSHDMSALRPEDVSVLYVLPEQGGARVEQIPISSEGDFTKDWPQGFFGERARELF
jgi:hypothetical protein